MNKGFWVAKSANRDPAFDYPSRVEPKRSRQWFVDTAKPEFFPNKKQVLETSNSSEISTANVPSWDNPSGFQSVPYQFMHHLFGPETIGTSNYAESATCPEDPEDGLSYGGFRKVKINQVKDAESGIHEQKGLNHINDNNSEVPTGRAFDRGSGSNFISVQQAYDKDDGNISLMGHNYNNVIPISEAYTKEETHMISFDGFNDAQDIIPIGRFISSYDQSYNQPSVQTPEAVHEKELDASNANAAASNTSVAKSKPESVSKNKTEGKASKKEAPNSFPSNVRSLISTGMLDGVPVKYVSVSREELRGIIQDTGYRCSCQSCNYSKVLNAYEFERHAGCKTKHPNNHIYFENGKTIYQIVQELRSTPESMLFDVIQTAFGAPINQKSFRMWKESFQAATRELQRIYGKG